MEETSAPDPQETPLARHPLDPSPNIPHLSLRPLFIGLFLIASILLGIGGYLGYREYKTTTLISSYEECVNAPDSRIQESYPATCITRNGKHFIQPIDDNGGVNPIYFDPFSCNTDKDCAIGIEKEGCCMCPQAINQTEIGNNGWENYVPGKDYSKQHTCETFVACKPCETPTTPVCRNNICVFNNAITKTIQGPGGYTCPATEWVDCEPGASNAGIKFECTGEFLTWAKTNCPGFKGAAL